ncbi:glycosyltransferase [Candidatus Pelagibacter sp.]|nr:glycosyltransferase [Candidatus Pelagibacter sp.]
MKRFKHKLSIVIPIYNEKNNLYLLTKKLISNLKNFEYEIIFVDDNSTDGSIEILKKLKKKYLFFKPIFRNKTPDLTQSCFTGIKQSKFKNILIMDGDLQHDPKYIKLLFDKYHAGNFDVVVGSRDFKQKNLGISTTRKYASLILISFFSIFKMRISDPMSGFFIFKKKIYTKNKKKLFGKGFKILIDLLLSSDQKLNVSELIIKFNSRHQNSSKMNIKILIYIIEFYCKSLIKLFFKFLF